MNNYTVRRPAEEKPNVLVSPSEAEMLKKVFRILNTGKNVEIRRDADGKPKIFNTDQGSQFTSTEFTKKLLKNEILISMDGRGRALDNIFIERLWRSLKYECIVFAP